MDLDKINAVYEKVSYYKRPEKLTLEEWQFALRKKYATQHQLIKKMTAMVKHTCGYRWKAKRQWRTYSL